MTGGWDLAELFIGLSVCPFAFVLKIAFLAEVLQCGQKKENYRCFVMKSFISIDLSQNQCALKGIVHPQMEILSSFPHSQIIPNLFDFFSSERKKEDFLFPYTSHKIVWLSTFFKIFSLFVFCRRTIVAGLEWHEGK